MFRLFHFPEGAEAGIEVEPSRLEEVRGDGWVWFEVTDFSTADLLRVGRAFALDSYALEEANRDTSFPTVEPYGTYTFVVSHAVAPDMDRLRLVEVDAFVGNDFLVTFSHEELPGFEWAREHAVTPGALFEASPDRLYARLSEVIALRFQPLIEVLDDRIVALEQLGVEGHPSVPAEVQALRRDIVMLRRGVSPQREVFSALERGDFPAIGDRARLRLGSVFDHCTRLTEEIDNARMLLGGVLDTYRSTVAEKANEVMKVLTVFAAIVLPLSLMAGVYGMNFTNIPELAWQWGYFGLLGLMALTALGLWIYFARRGFIGGPKLSTIPRGVGKGLSGLVGLTIKPTLKLLQLTQREDEDQPPTF